MLVGKSPFPLTRQIIPGIALGALSGCALAIGIAKAPLFLMAFMLFFWAVLRRFTPHRFFKTIQWFLIFSCIFSSYTHLVLVKKQQHWQQFETQTVEHVVTGVVQDRQCIDRRCTWTLTASPLRFTVNTPQIDCQVGDTLSVMAKLKKPHGHHNPGGTDNREQAALLKDIVGTAYAKTKPTCVLNTQPSWFFQLLRWRDSLGVWQAQHLNSETVGIVQALTIGKKQQINQDQWGTFRITGTSHLMAISGLHIGLMFLFAFSCSKVLFSCVPHVLQRVPLSIAAGWISFIVAFFYAIMSGWDIPAQRATAMLLCMLLTTTLRLPRAAWLGFWLALLVVLVSNPLALLSAGFWLSFGAVAFLIVLGLNGQQSTKKWQVMLQGQLLLSIALVPLSVAWFQGFSVISPIANLIAIPWVSFGIVPLTLIATLILPVSVMFAKGLLWLAAWQIQGLMALLETLAGFHWSYFSHIASPLAIVLALLGALWLTLPRGVPYKPLASLLWLPFFFQTPHTPPMTGARLILLDVGQGLSMIIQTRHHTVLYDTGPKTPYSDAGKDIVLPALQYYGIRRLDHIVVSHGDMDHRGGLPAIRAEMPYDQLLTSGFELEDSKPCLVGEQWSYDGVQFEVLHPKAKEKISRASKAKKNNDSCVILLTVGTQRILLTGDIEASVERTLSKGLNNIDLLIVPHHGSKTSSSDEFLKQLQPKQAWIPVGWNNLYHHPHPTVLARYQAHQIPVWRTDQSGALILEVSPDRSVSQPMRWRQKSWWWQLN